MNQLGPANLPDTIRSRVRKGLGGQAFGQGVGLLVQFLSVPIFLQFWGVQLYGEWLVLFAVPAYVVLSDLGFTTATTHDMTMLAARGDIDDALASFQTTWLIITAASLVVSAGLLAGGWLVPIVAWFNFSALDDTTALLVFALLLGQVVMSLQTNMVASALTAVGAYGMSTFLGGLARLLGFVLMVAAIVAGLDPVAAAAGLALGQTLGFAIAWLRARAVIDWLEYGVARVNRRTARRLFGPSVGFSAFVVGNVLAIQAPVIVLSAITGPGVVPIFTTLRTLTRACLMIGSSLFAIVRPEISMAFGKRDTALVRRLHARAVQFGVWLSALTVVALLAAGDWFVELWTVGKIAVEQPLFALLIAAMVVTTMWTASGTVLYATNRNKAFAAVYMVAAAASIALAAALAGRYAADGVALAMLAGELVTLAFVLVRALPFIEETVGGLVGVIWRPPVDALRLLRP